MLISLMSSLFNSESCYSEAVEQLINVNCLVTVLPLVLIKLLACFENTDGTVQFPIKKMNASRRT